jgi:hypothetical protein
MIRILREEPAFSEMFVSHLLERTIRVEADLVDQLFNSSEKRLAQLWQGRSARADLSENQPRDARGNDGDDASARELLHEQVSKIGPD